MPESKFDPKLAANAERVVRMALSGVARSKGRVGKGAVAGMLKGSNAKTIKKMGLDKLSTFGLLALWKTEEIEALLDALVRLRLIEQADDYGKMRPVARISERGRAVMRGDEAADVLGQLNEAVRSRIRAMPAEATPRKAQPAAPDSSSKAVPVAADPEPRRDQPQPVHSSAAHYWTWHLLTNGYSLSECLQIRNISRDTALVHLRRAAEERREIPLASVLSLEELAILSSAVRGRNNISPRTLFEELHGAVSAEAIELFLAARTIGHGSP
jgi:ATP-dependent DNA helicase RecQ